MEFLMKFVSVFFLSSLTVLGCADSVLAAKLLKLNNVVITCTITFLLYMQVEMYYDGISGSIFTSHSFVLFSRILARLKVAKLCDVLGRELDCWPQNHQCPRSFHGTIYQLSEFLSAHMFSLSPGVVSRKQIQERSV